MSRNISRQPLAARFEHLLGIISSQRFLEMKGLNNDLPFYICEFKAAEAFEMQRMQRQLVNSLASMSIDCLQGRGVRVLDVNLYDLSIELLKAREGSSEDSSLWDEILTVEPEVEKDALLELMQNVLGVEEYLIPAIGERLAGAEHDVLFLSGIGEVFPYIRSHNVLNNLQSTAKGKPTVMFFPGEYRHSLQQGASLELFGLLHDDKYYRAFNIFEIQV
ncbi:DUF1788 domain-containing protein [Pseudomonas aeruginosa]|uniref:DUF1788 domain-containing protein n=1 Tax=Pseudomonas aeruginosa TaxID=287 RepID=UPI0018C53FE8|nr:DUF1788 domain-containing protein [Pseudomonas aeruginosa]ELK4798161.1 DUF1788 domain-containing protein [Pseudomonas aeruginosa]ELK4827209.1 DUF1788 domain-containing protein [Pseudomonas aeruginosa]ELK4862109.1 DUF1788 domain-containing protein [Pseudomonas aeruginosa]MBG4530230.1 DUF1788 domain-containing protein [Pseudomonas aeruginosa]MBI7752408.1 DUF1788 domain-containing protein [Pseudomonas aeruginosa]